MHLLVEDFLVPNLNKKTFGEHLEWVNKKNGVFMMSQMHIASGAWTEDHGSVYKAWSVMKGHWLPSDSKNYVKAKHRLNCALNKCPGVTLLSKTGEVAVYEIVEKKTDQKKGKATKTKRAKKSRATPPRSRRPKKQRRRSSRKTKAVVAKEIFQEQQVIEEPVDLMEDFMLSIYNGMVTNFEEPERAERFEEPKTLDACGRDDHAVDGTAVLAPPPPYTVYATVLDQEDQKNADIAENFDQYNLATMDPPQPFAGGLVSEDTKDFAPDSGVAAHRDSFDGAATHASAAAAGGEVEDVKDVKIPTGVHEHNASDNSPPRCSSSGFPDVDMETIKQEPVSDQIQQHDYNNDQIQQHDYNNDLFPLCDDDDIQIISVLFNRRLEEEFEVVTVDDIFGDEPGTASTTTGDDQQSNPTDILNNIKEEPNDAGSGFSYFDINPIQASLSLPYLDTERDWWLPLR